MLCSRVLRSVRTSDALKENLRNMGIVKFTEIQNKAFEPILSGKNFTGVAATGSGKTIAYLLPTLQRIENEKFPGHAVLILVPTRELARQVGSSVIALNPKIDVSIFYGGVPISAQLESVGNSKILISTPGRAWELIESGAVSFARLKILILDEADFLLSKQQRGKMSQLLAALRRQAGEPQTLLFSASSADTVVKQPPRLTHAILRVAHEHPSARYAALSLLLESRDQALVFASSSLEASLISKNLEISNAVLHSGVPQSQRDFTLAQFKDGKIRVLIATDLVARGIDIPGLPCVIQFRPPTDFRKYMHRAGRTARGGAEGESILLVNANEASAISSWSRLADFKRMEPVTVEDLKVARMKRLCADIKGVGGDQSEIFRSLCNVDNMESLLAKILSKLDSGFAGEKEQSRLVITGAASAFEVSKMLCDMLGLTKLLVEPHSSGYIVTLEQSQARLVLGTEMRDILSGKGIEVSVSTEEPSQTRRRLRKLPWQQKQSSISSAS